MRNIFLEMLSVSFFCSSIMAVLIFSESKFLKDYSNKLKYFLGTILIFRMVFVFKVMVDVPKGLEKFFNQKTVENIIINQTSNLRFDSVVRSSKFSLFGVLQILWVIGFIGVVVFQIYKRVQFKRFMQKDIENFTEKYNGILSEIKKDMNITRKIYISTSKGISSPCLFGIFKGVILLPEEDYKRGDLNWILRHELTHFKRWDNLLKLLMDFTVALHFFNPIVYKFKKFFEEVCELSCDESITEKSEVEDLKEYAILLINTARNRSESTPVGVSSLTNKKIGIMKRRIEDMMNLKTKKKGLVLGALALVVAGGTIFGANTVKADDNSQYTEHELELMAKDFYEKEVEKAKSEAPERYNEQTGEIIKELK